MKIGEIASPSSRNPYLLGDFGCMFDEDDALVAPCSMCGAHEARRTRSDHSDVKLLQSESRLVAEGEGAKKLFSV